MAEKHTVAMFAEKDGVRTQVGWASPAHNGVRTFEFSPGFDKTNTPITDITFEDAELAAQEAAEADADEAEQDRIFDEERDDFDASTDGDNSDSYPQEGDEGKDSPPIQVDNNETVELNTGGSITSTNPSEDEDEAEFQRLLEEEQAAENDKPQTRREAREDEGGE